MFTGASDVYPKVGDKNRLVIQYESPVFAKAKTDLLPDLATVSQRKEGDHLVELNVELKNELWAESSRTIRHMLGKQRARVDLI